LGLVQGRLQKRPFFILLGWKRDMDEKANEPEVK
jgi:hypothetical protein